MPAAMQRVRVGDDETQVGLSELESGSVPNHQIRTVNKRNCEMAPG